MMVEAIRMLLPSARVIGSRWGKRQHAPEIDRQGLVDPGEKEGQHIFVEGCQ